MKVYSFYDKRGMLYVDCCECERGSKGDKSCSAGYRHKRRNKGGCFIGSVMEQYRQYVKEWKV